jgi:hypothetical protein
MAQPYPHIYAYRIITSGALLFLPGILFNTFAQNSDNQPITTLHPAHYLLNILSLVCLGVALVILSAWFFSIVLIKDLKKKYDLVNRWESPLLLTAGIFLVMAFAFKSVSWVEDTESFMLWISAAGALITIAGMSYVLFTFFRFYYPSWMTKRLQALRYKPRTSKSGNEMILLNEEEEDAYLDEGMQQEENVFSVNYDVWIDKQTQEIRIEEYQSANETEICPDCEYRTYQVVKEQILTPVTEVSSGELLKHLYCAYCGHKGQKTVPLHKRKNLPETEVYKKI